MEPPKSVQVYETSTSHYWYQEGVVHMVVKKTPSPSLKERREQLREFKEKMDGKKVCAVIDISNTTPTSRTNREFHTDELPNIFKAIAFVSTTPLGKMLAGLYLGLKRMPFPTKVFSNQADASEWIKKCFSEESNV
jgi:hypothetical protein